MIRNIIIMTLCIKQNFQCITNVIKRNELTTMRYYTIWKVNRLKYSLMPQYHFYQFGHGTWFHNAIYIVLILITVEFITNNTQTIRDQHRHLNLPLVLHICVSKVGKHWCRHRLVACSAPEPELAYCRLDSCEQISVKFESGFYHFH